MGYIYRPRLKTDAEDCTPTEADLALSRGESHDDQCHHPRHAKEDVSRGRKRHLRPDLQSPSPSPTPSGRMQSEVLALKWSQVDLNACTLRPDPGMTKNDDGRVVYLTPELVELLRAQEERVRVVESTTEKTIPDLFPYLDGKHTGKRIQDFRKAWQTSCVAAMLEGLEGMARAERLAEIKAAIARKEKPGLLKMLRHDFRRMAVRNMVNRACRSA